MKSLTERKINKLAKKLNEDDVRELMKVWLSINEDICKVKAIKFISKNEYTEMDQEYIRVYIDNKNDIKEISK